MKIEERNGYKFIKGDFREEIENPELNGLHLINCDIIEYDEDGVWFDTNEGSIVYYTNSVGEIEKILLGEEV